MNDGPDNLHTRSFDPILDYRTDIPLPSNEKPTRQTIAMWLGLTSIAMAVLPFWSVVHLIYTLIANPPNPLSSSHHHPATAVVYLVHAMPLIGLFTGISGLICFPASWLSRIGTMINFSMLGLLLAL